MNWEREEIIEIRGAAKDYSNIPEPDIDTQVRFPRPRILPIPSTQMFLQSLFV